MADERSRAKRWIVEDVIVEDHAVVVPLRIDPEDGVFWFEWPEAHEGEAPVVHVHPDRSAAKAMIRDMGEG